MSKTNVDEKMSGSKGNKMSLVRMRTGQKGIIVRISGGCGIIRKLEAFGIREGTEIKKISEQWMRGPVLLKYGNSQIALGFGMASKVLVKITGEGR
jgi:ferrous iron transport protein A